MLKSAETNLNKAESGEKRKASEASYYASSIRESQERDIEEKIKIGKLLLTSKATTLQMVELAERKAKQDCGDFAEKLEKLTNAANEYDMIAVSLLNEVSRIPTEKRTVAQQTLLRHYRMHDKECKSREFNEMLCHFEQRQAERTCRFIAAVRDILDAAEMDAHLLPKVREVATEILPESQTSPRVSFHELNKSPPRQYCMPEKAKSTPALFSGGTTNKARNK